MEIEYTDALIVVDLQNDFCHGGAMPVEGTDRIIAPVNRLIHAFDHLVFTRDWHPQDHCSFSETPEFRDGSWPEHCVQHSPGAEFHGSLHVPIDAYILSKGCESEIEQYGGFDPPELAAELQRRKVTRVFVCGVAMDYGVKETALGAIGHGLEAWVVEDACRPTDEYAVSSILTELSTAGVNTCVVRDVLPS